MFKKRNTPLHNIYTTMTCPRAQCQQARKAETQLLPRLDKPSPTEGIIIYEIVEAIDSETSQKTVYYWPIRCKY